MINNLGLLYNPKETASFFSRRWNVGTNPDLAFASFGQESRLPDRRVLGKFPWPQHRPYLKTPPRFKVPAHSNPVKRWNFRKADWKRRIAFPLKRRPELCSSTSQQPTTPYGTAASPASCCDCCLTDTWSTWSWRRLAIAALPLPPEMAKGAGYDASRTLSHRNLSWRPFSSTSTSLTCQPPSPESMHMLTT